MARAHDKTYEDQVPIRDRSGEVRWMDRAIHRGKPSQIINTPLLKTDSGKVHDMHRNIGIIPDLKNKSGGYSSQNIRSFMKDAGVTFNQLHPRVKKILINQELKKTNITKSK